MPDPNAIRDLGLALDRREFPSLVLWNRVEGRPRTHEFDRALSVEVRDALWMLTRQWQLGELRGDDAGSPVTVQVQVDRQPLTRLTRRDGPVEAFDDAVPLEAAIERRPVAMSRNGVARSLDLRLLLGRHWLRSISDLGPYDAEFIGAYAIEMPDPANPDHAQLCAHLEVWQSFAAAAGRRMDGWQLYEHLTSHSANRPDDGVAGISAGDRTTLELRGREFVEWVRNLILAPAGEGNDAWTPDRLEYQCAIAASAETGERVFVAEEYRGGSLDWYAFDASAAASSLAEEPTPTPALPTVIRQATLPVQVTFHGMPSTRWWEIEDGRTNFGKVRADTTDLAKLLLIEFGLVYGNDWFVVPCTLPAGSVARVRGLVVTNVFGERLWIDPLDENAGASNNFSLFRSTSLGGSGASEPTLLLLPTVPALQEGPVLEEALLVRDEIANMVWGIERTVQLASGAWMMGATAGRETLAWHQRLLDERLAANPDDRRFVPPSAPVRYRVMTSVPEEWIPFIPVHVPADNRETQLQRGAMPRILAGDPDDPAKVRPQTQLLRFGLDVIPKLPYFIHEEEATRAGARITQRFQRARGRDGRVVVWLGARKETGRGDASSGLAFDTLVNQ